MFRSAEGITLSLVFDALPVAFSYMAPWALIVAATLAATMVYGRLAAENEIDAMRTSGIHMGRIVAPALLYAVFVFILGFFIQHELAPWARFHRRGIVGETVMALLKNPPGGYKNVKLGSTHRLIYLDARDGVIEEPFFLIFNAKGELIQQYHGKSGVIRVLDERSVEITLRDGSLVIYEMVDGIRKPVLDADIGERNITIEIEDPKAKAKDVEDESGLDLVSQWARSEGA